MFASFGHRKMLQRTLPVGLLLALIVLTLAGGAPARARTTAAPPVVASVKIAASLQQAFAAAGGAPIRYLVVLHKQADTTNTIVDWQAKGWYVLDTLRQTAQLTQPPVAAALARHQQLGHVTHVKSYYILNGFQVVGNLAAANALAV